MVETTPLRFHAQAVNEPPAMARRTAGFVAAAVAAMVLCFLGTIYCCSTTVAQALFFRARLESTPAKTQAMLRTAELAHRLYPFNYGLCVLCADTAFLGSLNAAGADGDALLESARTWCERGLALNSYDRRLVFRKMGILGATENTHAAALELWEQYTDWDFWNPDNHFYLGMMYVMSGNLEKARESVNWARGSAYYSRLVRSIEEASKSNVSQPAGK